MEASTSCCKKTHWFGRVMSALAALPFIMSSGMKLSKNPQVIAGFAHFGWPESAIIPLGIIEMSCVLLYLIPPTSVLGAIILTGFLGGAISTHVRIGEPVFIHIGIGIFIWGGLFLREARLRDLIPTRSTDFLYEREIMINRPSQVVFNYIKELKNFRHWNPFLKKDPNPKVEYHGNDGQVGFVASWDGNKELGAGEQEITNIIDGKKIEFVLRFKRPFKGTNQGYFAIESIKENQAKVKWGMSGKSTFPMNIIGLFINCEKMLGNEFESGLSQLKTILEK